MGNDDATSGFGEWGFSFVRFVYMCNRGSAFSSERADCHRLQARLGDRRCQALHGHGWGLEADAKSIPEPRSPFSILNHVSLSCVGVLIAGSSSSLRRVLFFEPPIRTDMRNREGERHNAPASL